MRHRLLRFAPWIVVAVAFVARLIHVFEMDASPIFGYPVVDGKTYLERAMDYAGGNWMGAGDGPYWQGPLYPWFLGVVLGIFGDAFFYAARILQAALGTATCWLTFDLGRRLFTREVGLLAGLATALYGPLVFFDGELLPASLAAFLDLWGIWLLVRALEDGRIRRFLWAGVVLGLGALAVATVLPFLAAAVVYVGWLTRRRNGAWGPALRRAGLVAAGATLVIAPVTLRNYVVGGDAVLISWNGGVNYFIGNNPEYERTVAVRPGWEWADLVTRPDRAGATRPSEKSRYFFEEARDFILSNPTGWLGLQLEKTAEFWRGDELGRNQPIYYWRHYSTVLAATLWKWDLGMWGLAFPFGLLAPLALLGMAVSLRRPETRLPLFFVLVYSTSVIAFFPAARYRIPVIPVLAIFAATGGIWLLERFRGGSPRRALAGATALLLLVLVANTGLSPMDMEGNADIHYNLGDAHLRAGRLDQAWASFGRALELDPAYLEARFNLGTIRGMQGDAAGAVTILTRVAEAAPHRPEVWLNLASAHLTAGQVPEARASLESALDADPRHQDSYVQLLALLLREGDLGAARAVLARAQEALPADAELFQDLYDRLVARSAATP